MKNILPVASTLLVGLFGIFGVDADEQTILALITGLFMAGTATWTIIQANRK